MDHLKDLTDRQLKNLLKQTLKMKDVIPNTASQISAKDIEETIEGIETELASRKKK